MLSAVLLAVILLTALPADVLAITFGPLIDVSNDEEISIDHDIAVDGDNVYIAWDGDSPLPTSILIKASTDGGGNFTDAELVSNGIEFSSAPRIAANGDTVYIVWVNEGIPLNGDLGEIYFRKGTVSGGVINFDGEQNLSQTPDSSLNPQIATANGNVYVLWEEDVGGSNDIFYAASFDDGDTFIQNNLSNSTEFSERPRVVAFDDSAFITWTESDATGEVFFTKATVTGGSISFSAFDILSSNLASFAFAPKIALSGSNVHVVWEDLNLLDIYYATSIDGGDSFDIPADDTDNNVSNNGNSRNPNVFALDEDAYVVWVNDNAGSGDVFFNKGTISGSTLSFAGEIPIDEDAEISNNPVISVSDTNVYVAWDLGSVPGEVFVSVSTDGGETFGTINLSNNAGESLLSRVASSIDRGYVTWQDDVSGDYDILIRTIEETGPPSITIESVSDSTPRWDLDSVVISGFVNGNGTDTISIDWDDGNVTSGISVNATTWGPILHVYDSANTGSKQIVVTLLNETSAEMASDTADITVQKHATSLTIDPIFSVVEGADIAVAGVLTDTDASAPIEAADITFSGTGVAGLPTTVTVADGSYSETGASPSLVSELLTVQAHFAGDDAYEASDSATEGYDTVAIGTDEFVVLTGSPSGPIDLTGFGASIVFDNVLSDGSIFVSDCTSPASARYETMATDHCIKISPAVELDPDFTANLTVMFDENDIPAGFTIEDIDIFHEGLSGITDITAARDEDASTVTGTITDFSKFIIGAAVHDDAPAGAARQQVFISDNDLVFNFTATKEIALDGGQYAIGETVTLNVTDPSRNLDDASPDTIDATVNSTSDQTGITVDLVETGDDTNVFEGMFTLTSGPSSNADAELHVEDGDEIEATYEEYTKAPFRVILENITESGLAELVDFETPGNEEIDPVGDGYELSLIDASIADDTVITVVMSYENVEFLLGDDPSELKMYRMDGTTCLEDMTVSVDVGEETVTGNTTEFGKYTLAFAGANPPGLCPPGGGGGGGGLPRPGNGGLLLDFATVLGTIEDDSSDSDDNSSGGGGGRRVVVIRNEPDEMMTTTVDTFPESHFADKPLDRIRVGSTGFMDAEGNKVSQGKIGQQISIASTFSNHQQGPQEYSFIVLVIDKDGFAVDIAWQEGTLESGETANLSISWMPQDDGSYTIKMFVWDGLENPSPLSGVLTGNIGIV